MNRSGTRRAKGTRALGHIEEVRLRGVRVCATTSIHQRTITTPVEFVRGIV